MTTGDDHERTASIAVGVDLDGRHADARVDARVGELPESAVGAALARAWLLLAELAGSDEAHETAGEASRRGLDELGGAHRSPDGPPTKDDTGMKILAAEKASHPGERAALLRGALQARLADYQERHAATDLTFEPPVVD